MAKFIQLFRNQLNAVFADKATAKSALENNNINPDVLKDGMPILARYYTSGTGSAIKTLFGVAHNDGTSAIVTVFDSSSVDELDSTLTATTNEYFSTIDIVDGKLSQGTSSKANVDTAQIVDYVENTATEKSATNLATTDTIAQALAKVEQRVDIEEDARKAAIQDLDYTGVTNETTKVVTNVVETDGVVSAQTTNVDNLQITGITTANTKVAANDTISTAFGKLQGQIDSMDLAEVSVAGQPIIAISEADGVVSATAGTITATAVTIADSGNNFTSTEVEGALAELAAKTAVNSLSSSAKTINITTASTGTNIDVNVDGTTILIDGTSGALKSGLSVKKYTTGLTSNVKEQYRLVDTADTQIGDAINIYKDSSLYEVYLGHVDDTIAGDPPVVTSGSGDTALCFIYHKEDGTYELAAVNVESFLEETEFADGLQVSNHVVSVKVDSTSEKVITGQGATADVLTVGASGVSVNNIQNAIDYAVSTLDATVSSADTSGFVTVTVAEVDGKLTGVTVATNDIASATALTAEIAARKAVDGINGDAYTANTGTKYISNATSLNDADVKLDTALSALSENVVTAATMTGGTVNVANNTITIDTDGSQITLSGYTSGTAQADITTASTVNQAIGQLEYRIAQGTGGLQTEVDAIEEAVGLANDGTHVQSSGKYISAATTVEGEISALNDQLVTVSTTYISSAITGNNGVTVVENAAAADSGKTVTVSLKLDTATSSTTATAQYVDSGSDNVLQITSGATGGLYLDSSWDCGFYSYQATPPEQTIN